MVPSIRPNVFEEDDEDDGDDEDKPPGSGVERYAALKIRRELLRQM